MSRTSCSREELNKVCDISSFLDVKIGTESRTAKFTYLSALLAENCIEHRADTRTLRFLCPEVSLCFPLFSAGALHGNN